MSKSQITIPSIHMNGTSAGELQREVREAFAALGTAREKLAAMTVHSRDHYVKADPNSFKNASAEHRSRLLKIDEIATELMLLHEGIVDQT